MDSRFVDDFDEGFAEGKRMAYYLLILDIVKRLGEDAEDTLLMILEEIREAKANIPVF